MTENIRLYNEQGQVNDPNIAHSMAKIEDYFRSKKRFGFYLLLKKL
jgi:hypothetical protein